MKLWQCTMCCVQAKAGWGMFDQHKTHCTSNKGNGKPGNFHTVLQHHGFVRNFHGNDWTDEYSSQIYPIAEHIEEPWFSVFQGWLQAGTQPSADSQAHRSPSLTAPYFCVFRL